MDPGPTPTLPPVGSGRPIAVPDDVGGRGWPVPSVAWFDEDMELPIGANGLPIPQTCECVKYLHEPPKPGCQNPPEEHGSVVSSPPRCTRCLFYCYNDDEEF